MLVVDLAALAATVGVQGHMDPGKMLAIFLAPIAAQLYVKAQTKWHAYLDGRDRKREEAKRVDSWAVANVIVGRIAHDPEASTASVGSDGLPSSTAIEQRLGEHVAITETARDPAPCETRERP